MLGECTVSFGMAIVCLFMGYLTLRLLGNTNLGRGGGIKCSIKVIDPVSQPMGGLPLHGHQHPLWLIWAYVVSTVSNWANRVTNSFVLFFASKS